MNQNTQRPVEAAGQTDELRSAAPDNEEGGPTDQLVSMLHSQRSRLLDENVKLRAALSDVPAVGGATDECAAAQNGHRFGPHGRKGERQCEWCGVSEPVGGALVATKDQAMVDLMPKRAAFLVWAKSRALDVTEDKDAWGKRKFAHSHVQALWDGWFNAPATYAAPAGALVAKAEQDQAHVMPPARGTGSQHDAKLATSFNGLRWLLNISEPHDRPGSRVGFLLDKHFSKDGLTIREQLEYLWSMREAITASTELASGFREGRNAQPESVGSPGGAAAPADAINSIIDHIADNWPMKKYSLEEIEVKLRELATNGLPIPTKGNDQ